MESRLIDRDVQAGIDRSAGPHQHLLLLGSIGFGLSCALLSPGDLRLTTRFLVGWNVAALGFMLLLAVQMLKCSEDSFRRVLVANAATGRAVLGLSALAAIASFTAVLTELSTVKQVTGFLAPMHIAFAVLTIVSAWAFIHTMFALHYANSYYVHQTTAGASQSALDIPGVDGKPDFIDFLYFAFTIGLSCATSDTAVHSRRLRRTVMVHGILTFFFNMVILGFTINIAATFF
jgi:uncharacterized membrane protein